MKKEQFIKSLEREHATIVKIFNRLEPVLNSGRIDNSANVLKDIGQLKDILIQHLKKEDEIFYPDMREKAVELKQNALLPALDFFMEDMRNISKKVFDFFSKYMTGEEIMAHDNDFFVDTKDTRDILIKRINTEEGTLYYIYKAYYHL